MTESTTLHAEIPAELAGLRLDQALAEIFPDFSRSRLQSWLKAGHIHIEGLSLQAKDRVQGGERVSLETLLEASTSCTPQHIPLDIVYEDEHLLIVNKPAGLVVHPAAGHADGTLQNALLAYAPELAAIPRAGIVHRLDKDTSGLLMVARTLAAHHYLVDKLQERDIHREYYALVYGRMTAGGTIDEPIGRHGHDRLRFAVRDSGKRAVTHYRVIERLAQHTLARVQLETGRTHQIRVHLSHIRYPIVGDPLYGRLRLPAHCSPELADALQHFKRQALHAARLMLEHPITGEGCEWHVDMPDDMKNLLELLRKVA